MVTRLISLSAETVITTLLNRHTIGYLEWLRQTRNALFGAALYETFLIKKSHTYVVIKTNNWRDGGQTRDKLLE